MNNMLPNYLTWSEQRAKSIHSCPRQYAFRHVQAWGGWMDDAPWETQEAYHLNSVVPDLRIAVGTIIHDRAGRVLKRIASGMESNLSTEIAIAEEDFDRLIADSATLPLTSLGGKRKKLLCHLLDQELPDALVSAERAGISTMLRHFFASPELRLFATDPGCLMKEFVEEMGPPTHELGVPARLVTDAVFNQDGIVHVLDWKTGKPREEHREKALVYDIFVRGRLGLGADNRVKVRFLYLRTGESAEFEFGEEERMEARWRVGEDFALMQEKSSDPVYNIAAPDTFPALTEFHCLSCSHQRMCKQFALQSSKGFFDRFKAKEFSK